MPTNWRAIFNRLWPVLNTPGEAYFGGPRFIAQVQDVDGDFPPYSEFIEQRRREGKSTSRKDYYYDILMELSESDRTRVVRNILDVVDASYPDAWTSTTRAVHELMDDGGAPVPAAIVPPRMWNAGRLNDFLRDINGAIDDGQFDRAVTLSYTCLEGFYKAFYRAKQDGNPPNDLIDLAKWTWNYLRTNIGGDYPDEVLALVKTTAHALDRARNKFSESHFEGEAAQWLATYVRDLTNTQIRLLLHFM